MKFFRYGLWVGPLVVALLLDACICESALSESPNANAKTAESMALKSRVFKFQYAFSLHELPANGDVRVWLPIPRSDSHQDVTVVKQQLPADARIDVEARHGNKIAYFRLTSPPSGQVSAAMMYRVRRKEVRGLQGERKSKLQHPEQLARYMAANRMVPITGKPLDLLGGMELPTDTLARARAIYDLVDQHVRYDKSKSGYGNGDVLWVCDSRFGNCTDFHSLFISLARGSGLPARFEIGFPLPPKRGQGPVAGYHCWAKFYDDKLGWVPVDISEADKHPEQRDYYFGNLTADRITFTTGRDITLAPKQNGPPLNYFVYPYVEVNGTPWPRSKLKLKFSYEDQPSTST